MTMSFTPSPEMIDAVMEWRQRQPDERLRRSIVPLLRERFKISASEAVAVIRESDLPGGADAS